MNQRCIAIAAFVLLFISRTLFAADVYKCTNPQGGITFQDHACASGEQETTVRIIAPPPGSDAAGDPAADADASPLPSTPTPPAAATSSNIPGHRPLPPMWLCTRPEDGSHYLSHDGNTAPRMVPLGVFGVPGKPLATAYAPGGIGVSAPGARKPPISTSKQDELSGDYTAVQDQCVRASAEETCSELRKQLDEVREKLRRAFKDDRAVLEPQRYQLEDQLDDC